MLNGGIKLKKRISALALSVFLLLTCYTSVLAAPEDITLIEPKTVATISSSLTRYSASQLHVQTTCVLTTKQNIVITTQLQRWTGSSWQTYKSFIKTGNNSIVTLDAKVIAPLGYIYRTKSIVTTETLSGITSYSKELHWY